MIFKVIDNFLNDRNFVAAFFYNLGHIIGQDLLANINYLLSIIY